MQVVIFYKFDHDAARAKHQNFAKRWVGRDTNNYFQASDNLFLYLYLHGSGSIFLPAKLGHFFRHYIPGFFERIGRYNVGYYTTLVTFMEYLRGSKFKNRGSVR